MIHLPWRVKPEVNEGILKAFLNRIATRSGTSTDFTIQIPKTVLAYIKDEGINAEIIELADNENSTHGMVTIRVIKFKTGPEMHIC